MVRLAVRNLFQSKVRLVISVGGVALALLLILALDAIWVGAESQVTAFIDHSGADVFVSQSGVRNMHMAASSLPFSDVDRVRAVQDVESVAPILYVGSIVVIGENRHLAYIIGLPPDAAAGKPWRISAGKSLPGPNETIIDRSVADASGVGIGDTVRILGQEFVIAGLSEGTVNIVNSIAFISLADFMRLRGTTEAVNYLLVEAAPGSSAEALAGRINSSVPGVTALPRTVFAQEERRVVSDMSADVIAIMNFVGFLIGIAVMALTVYTATINRRAEYGVLKAVGARTLHLYSTVIAQAFASVSLAFAVSVALTVLLAAVVPRFSAALPLAISGASLLKVAGAALLIAGLSAVLPIQQIAGLDPVTVFRRRIG